MLICGRMVAFCKRIAFGEKQCVSFLRFMQERNNGKQIDRAVGTAALYDAYQSGHHAYIFIDQHWGSKSVYVWSDTQANYDELRRSWIKCTIDE